MRSDIDRLFLSAEAARKYSRKLLAEAQSLEEAMMEYTTLDDTRLSLSEEVEYNRWVMGHNARICNALPSMLMRYRIDALEGTQHPNRVRALVALDHVNQMISAISFAPLREAGPIWAALGRYTRGTLDPEIDGDAMSVPEALDLLSW